MSARLMSRSDLPRVLEIEHRSFVDGWCEGDFLYCLRQQDYLGLVALGENDTVIGFTICELQRGRAHVLNLAVDPSCRRCRLGSEIVEKLRRNFPTLTLEVRERNLVAQLFFRSVGFRAIQVVRGFYRDTEEDAFFMESKG